MIQQFEDELDDLDFRGLRPWIESDASLLLMVSS